MRLASLLWALLAALLGAALAIVVVAAFGLGGASPPTVTVKAPAPTAASGAPDENWVRAVYQRAAPGVVQVTSTSAATLPGFGQPAGEQVALGSGFVIDRAGHVVTNYHVVEGAKSVAVSFSDNESYKAKIVGSDPSTDVAVLKVDVQSKGLDPLPFGDSNKVQVGDPVVAIGNPFGLDRTATAGIVSALQRQIQAPNGFPIDRVIQTDAAINHGNSGGPLLDARGRVIGITSQILTGGVSEGNVGVGFVVPANTVRVVARELIATGHVEHPYLGVRLQEVSAQAAKELQLSASGLLVEAVTPGSGAAKAGLQAGKRPVTLAGETYLTGGDLIVAIQGQPTATIVALRDQLAKHDPGDTIELTIYRGSERLTVAVVLGRQPAEAQ